MSKHANHLPDLDNLSFRDSRQIQELRKKLDEQKEALKELVSLVKESKTESLKQKFTPQFRLAKPEQDQITFELLEEVKTLRRQINNIESGPKSNPIQNPIIIPQYLPTPQQALLQPMPPYMYMNPYFQMPQSFMHQQPQNQAHKKKVDPYKKLVLKILQKGEQYNHRSRRDSNQSDYSEDSNDLSNPRSNRHRSQKDRHKDKGRDLSYQNKTSKGSLHDSYVSKYTRSSVKIKAKKPREFTETEKLQLRRKLSGTFWFIRIGLVLRKYLRRVWLNRRQQYYENEAQQLIDKFDHEFNHKEVFILLVVECNKNRLFNKNWNIYDNRDIEAKSKIVFQILTILFKKLPFLTKNSISEEHKQFVKKISSPGGFLLPGHPKFVTDRVQLRPNVTIGQITAEVSKMIQMDYVYIQVIVQKVLLIHEWYSQFNKIPNHKEAMKILVSVLHQLFIDQFSTLKVYENNDAIYNKQQVVFCDFTQFNYVDIAITIDDKHFRYEVTTDCCILGLATKEELQQLYDQAGYKELQTTFKEYLMKLLDDTLDSKSTDVYYESSSRYLQLTLFLGALVSNIMFGFSLSPITKEISTIYGVSQTWLQLLSVSFTLFSAIMIIPGNILSEKYGIQYNIKLGCLLTFIGSLMALLVNYSFWWLYFGELVSLVGFPFRLISASKFTANWFYPKNRIIIMVIIALLFNSSTGISIKIPLFIFGDYDVELDALNDYSQGRTYVFQLMAFLAGIMFITTVPTLIFFKAKPRHPPSYSASEQCVRENYTKAAKMLIKNADYLKLAFAFSLILGPVLLLTVQMEFVVKPFGYNLEQISNVILVGVIAGLIGDVVVGSFVKKLGKYKIVLQICNATTTLFYGFLILSLVLKVHWLFYVCYFFVCMCSSILALTFEFSCEISFPVSETSTIAYLGLIGNGFNFLQAIPEILILQVGKESTSIITLIIMFGIGLFGNFVSYSINEKLKRQQVDNLHDTKQNLESQYDTD
ncbi:unnamed protein product [Paramecium octaurelia]|uniref:Major facilitator superfamily protein n=1 Tax=Paramecium octaurelia TaxID=43137 RepID=A0A8S1V7K4_PAROT|nr:unnamed protein product [Paramecium octaurelia]